VSDFSQLYDDSYAVFRKYQMTIHNDTASDCTQSDFSNFLVDTQFMFCRAVPLSTDGMSSLSVVFGLAFLVPMLVVG